MTKERLHAIRDDAKAAQTAAANFEDANLVRGFQVTTQNILDLVAEVERLNGMLEAPEVKKFKSLAARLRDPEAYVDACDEAADLLEKLEVFNSPTGEIVLWFAGEMEKQLALPKNRAKGNQENWRGDPPLDLADRIGQELIELSIEIGRAGCNPERMPFVIKEAADLANFAMMIADQAAQAMGANEAGQPTPNPSQEGNGERPDDQTDRTQGT